MRLSQSAIAKLRDPNRAVRVYTFQHRDAYATALRRGYLTGSEEHARDDDDEWGWNEQYDWMRGQMALRIPDYTGEYPIWSYLVRPNLRRSPYHGESVLIVADVPRVRMLISDHSAWHIPLNRWYVTETEQEDDALRMREGAVNYADRTPRPISPAMKASWERIFEIGAPPTAEGRAWHGLRDDLQACIDRIYLREIVRVTERPGRLGRRGGKEGRRPNAESQPEGLA
jgi:hypothetical protein